MQNNRRAGKPAGKKPDKTGLLGLFTKGKDIPTTAQQTLPYREMYRDGVCRVEDRYYTKTIEYEDINYQLAQTEDQAAIFDGWSACLNYFDSSLPFQLSFLNHRSRPGSRYSVNIPMQEDDYNSVRREYVEMLENQIAKSNNGIVRTKLLTFGVNVDDLSTARARLERVEADICGNFKKLGVKCRSLSGLERLELLHGQLHPGGTDPFRFSWDMIPQTGLSTKDFIAPDSPHHINPMDIDLSFDEENPMALKADFILSLMELIVGGKDGLQPVERTVIDRCVRQMYREHLQNPETAKMPTLQTLYDLLCSQPEGEAVRLATALEIYVSGSLNVFNHETNVDLNRRLVCLDLKKLGAGLRTIAMLIMQDLVNSQVSMNFLRGIATWCYFDEFHVLLRDRLTASYCVAIWKMLRKKGCVPSALTQNVKDFLASPEIENIFENSDFLVLLSQAQGDRQILAKQLGISPHQLSYVTHTNSGEGLLFFGNTTIPFVDRFPQNTELYAIMTTRPEDKKQEMKRA